MYTSVVLNSDEPEPTHETNIVDWNTHQSFPLKTVIPGVKIPTREFVLNPEKIAQAQESVRWIMDRFHGVNHA